MSHQAIFSNICMSHLQYLQAKHTKAACLYSSTLSYIVLFRPLLHCTLPPSPALHSPALVLLSTTVCLAVFVACLIKPLLSLSIVSLRVRAPPSESLVSSPLAWSQSHPEVACMYVRTLTQELLMHTLPRYTHPHVCTFFHVPCLDRCKRDSFSCVCSWPCVCA